MNKLLVPLMACAFAACSHNEQSASYSVIPLPQEINTTQESGFKLNNSTRIVYPEGNGLLQRNAQFLSEYIRQATGYAPPNRSNPSRRKC